MTETQPTIAKGAEYLVIYVDGPNDGQTDHRISTDGTFDAEITVLTAVGGKETLTDYTIVSWVEVGDQYHVTYAFDAKDSEPMDDPEDRGDRQ
jgi:hypothetical protein